MPAYFERLTGCKLIRNPIKYTVMSKCISSKKLTDTLSLSECTDGFWLYDKTQGMNISMRAKTEERAFIEALTFYQKRYLALKSEYDDIKAKVHTFILSAADGDDIYDLTKDEQ